MQVGHQVLRVEDFPWVLENESRPGYTMHYGILTMTGMSKYLAMFSFSPTFKN